MKIYFQNKAARLKLNSLIRSCKRCPFYKVIPCPFGTSTMADCYGKGWWIDGESLDVFKI